MNVSGIIKIMEQTAPPHLAEDWDNSGLQFGGPDWPVHHIFLALEPTLAAAEKACAAGADMLITHHPLIFKPLTSVDTSTPPGAVIDCAARHRLAVYAAHTNLDSVRGGINDVLCEKLGIKSISPLCPGGHVESYKLVIFVPRDYAARVIEALCDSPAGKIGNYSCCTFRSPGTGTFRPEEGADPWDGKIGELAEAPEIRLETVVEKSGLETAVESARAVHPYETMAYDVYPLKSGPVDEGLGRIGIIEPPRTLAELARDIKEKLSLESLRYAGPADLEVKRAAVCSGGGGGVLGQFFASDAQVLVTGDMRYHDAVNAAEKGRGIIDAGHFASERIIVPVLRQRLENALADAGENVRVTEYTEESDPFVCI